VRRPDGFTLIEMLISMAIMTLVVGAVFAVFNPTQGAFQTQPEVSDMQERLRVAVTGMASEIVMAGAGSYRGATKGSLLTVTAPIFPYRLGTLSADPKSGVFFRTDAMTAMYVTSDAPEATLAATMLSPSADITLSVAGSCPSGTGVCGFSTGDRALIFDGNGAVDTFTVTGTVPASNIIQHGSDVLSRAYPAGSQVARIAMNTFYLKTDTSTSTYQLVQFDGYQTESPLVDNVVALEFSYFGDPDPPVITNAVSNPEGPWTSYGPKPPLIGADNTADSWPAGENCAFTVSAGAHVPRLTDFGAGALVPLTQAQLTDGPWCPDAASPNRYDADLLRIRKVRVMIRVQVGQASMRGPSGTLFTRGGQAKEGARFVPDQQVVFDVAPRNVNLTR
jgi:prepilin-type N-terminal cleavage/methylation domain-containing protein